MKLSIILDIHDILPEFHASKFQHGHDSLLFKSFAEIERVSAAFTRAPSFARLRRRPDVSAKYFSTRRFGVARNPWRNPAANAAARLLASVLRIPILVKFRDAQ